MPTYTATYSPEDNKLRLYASTRLDRETFDRVKELGFKWAPQQRLFVAPKWTPAREDLLIELAGEIEDEDKTLAERAEERAERFNGHSESRLEDANRTRDAVRKIADAIPFGQPILVGHHSEARARKDAARIQDGMGRAVRLWDQSEYWSRRAAASLAHAEHKENPGVRARRLKGLEADMRAAERLRDQTIDALNQWSKPGITHAEALLLARCLVVTLPLKPGDPEGQKFGPTAYGILANEYPDQYAPRTLDEVVEAAKTAWSRPVATYNRWIAHYTNRIAFERAMLSEQGAMAATDHDIEIGGRVEIGGKWYEVTRVTRKGGRIVSVSLNTTYRRIHPVEVITNYEAPAPEKIAAAKAANKLPPICNYAGESFVQLTKAEWDKVPKHYRGVTSVAPTTASAAHRVRCALGAFLPNDKQGGRGRHYYHPVYLTEEKQKSPPAADVA